MSRVIKFDIDRDEAESLVDVLMGITNPPDPHFPYSGQEWLPRRLVKVLADEFGMKIDGWNDVNI